MNFENYNDLREFFMSRPEYISRIRSLFDAKGSVDPADTYERKAFVFVHIQKCAGTSINNAIERCFEPHTCCPERFNHLHLYSPSELAPFDFYSGHFDLRSINYIPRRNKFVFAIFRAPVERLISYYRFVRSHQKNAEILSDPMFAIAETSSIHEYFAHPVIRKSRLVNNHYRAVLSGSLSANASNDTFYSGTLQGALDALRSLDALGITEEIGDSYDHICRNIGISDGGTLQHLMNAATMHINEPKYEFVPLIDPDESLMSILSDLVTDDIKIYDQAKILFKQRTTHDKDQD